MAQYNVVQHQVSASGVTGTPTASLTWATAPTQGNLLVTALTFRGNATTSEATAQGWVKGPTIQNGVNCQTELWYRVAGPGEGTTGPSFNTAAVLYEIAQAEISGFVGTPIFDQSGTNTATAATSLTVAVGAAVVAAGEFVVGVCGNAQGNTAAVNFNASTAGGGATLGADIDTVNPPKNGEGIRDTWATAGGAGTLPSLTFNVALATNNVLAGVVATFKVQTQLVGPRDPSGLAPQLLPGATPYSFMVWAPMPVGTVAPTGPQSFFVTATDTLTSITDSAVRAVQNFPRTITDTLTSITDTATRAAQAFTLTATDTLTTVTDTATRAAMSMVRTATDTLTSVTDSATRAAQAFTRTATDTLTTITDSAAGVKILVRTATDTLTTVTDSVSRAAQSFPRTLSDTLTTVTDSASRAAQAFVRTATDTLTTITDSAAGVKILVRTAVDTLTTVTDSASRAAQSFPRTVSDTLTTITDSATRAAQSLPRTLSDTLTTITDSATRIPTMVRTATDTLPAVTDTVARGLQALARTASDVLTTITDTVVGVAGLLASAVKSPTSVFGGGPNKISSTGGPNQSSGGGPNKVQ